MTYDITVNDSSFLTPDTTWTSPSTTWWYNSTVYFYQLSCPQCKTLNWGQIDKEITCRGTYRKRPCAVTLKAVTKKADFEVEVGE